MDKKTKTIALCGKGGVGKTSVSALIIKNLAQRKDLRILAIDAERFNKIHSKRTKPG